MFGNDSLPSKVMVYGCRVDTNLVELQRQLRYANRYRNQIVEIELKRRAQVDELTCEVCPDLKKTEEAIEARELEFDELEVKVKKFRQASRKRSAAPKELREELTQARKDLKVLRARRKELRQATFENPKFKSSQIAIDESDKKLMLQARKDCNLYWGTYLAVEQAMSKRKSGAPPRFKRFRGDGRIAVQLQKGISPEQSMSCEDNRIRIEPVETPGRKTGGRRDGRKHRIWIRVGSDGRRPIWATVLSEVHREIPPGSQIKWVYLIARRVATKTNWTVQFVVSSANGFPRTDDATEGNVAVNLGWRTKDGEMRTAYWLGSDGEEGELVIPPAYLRRLPKCDALKSTRDKDFDTMKKELSRWMKEHKPGNGLPAASADGYEWLRSRLDNLSHWRAQAKLALVSLLWRDLRFGGDEAIFCAVESWRKQDKHLYEWQENNRRKYQAWRLDLYRNFARDLRRKYKTLVLGKIDWRVFQKKPRVEESDEKKLARARKGMASPSILEGKLRNAFSDVEEMSAKNITRTCHVCDKISGEVNPQELIHTCVNCGSTFDQDRNACINLMRASDKNECVLT